MIAPADEAAKGPASVLFVCNMNMVRSPMAAAIAQAMLGEGVRVDSAGIYEGGLDPFALAVMAEQGIDLSDHVPKSFRQAGAGDFDLIVALTPEAAETAAEYAPSERIEYWPIENPSSAYGSREAVMEAYRAVREILRKRISERFCA